MRMTTSDEDLAEAAAAGDGAAFASLLDRHYDRLFAFCFRLTGSRADAEDLTQDICAALPAKLGSYQRRAKVTTWLYRVAVNAAHDRRRKRATYARATTGWGDWEIQRTAENDDTAEKEQIQKIVFKLIEKQCLLLTKTSISKVAYGVKLLKHASIQSISH